MRIIIDRDLKLRPYNIKDKTSLYKNSTDPLFLKYMVYNKFSYAQFNSWLKIKIKSKDEIREEYDLFAFEDVKKLNVFSRLMKSINFLIWGDV